MNSMLPSILSANLWFAQVSSIQSEVDAFLNLVKILLLPVATVVGCFAAWQIHEGRVREGILALVGALILALAIPIARYLFTL